MPLFILPLIGRFHPLIVHLPIGFILFALILMYYPRKDKNLLLPTVQFALLLSTLTAFFACITGIILYNQEGYAFDTVQNHLILGILTALTCLSLFLLVKKHQTLSDPKIHAGSAILFLCLTFTGHLGGNLTHGETYLTEVLPEGIQETFGWKIEEQFEPLSLNGEAWEEALFYEDVVQPILNQNCRSCHNEKNSKGDLILTSKESLLEGGKNGEVIFHKTPMESELIKRMLLPLDHEDHMPPKEKRQPVEAEVELIKAWLLTGASFGETLGQSGISMDLVSTFFEKNEASIYPEVQLEPLEEDVLKELKGKGFFIEKLSVTSPLLKVSTINFPEADNQDLESLEPILVYITILDLSLSNVTDDVIPLVGKMENLTILKLNETKIEGQSFEMLKGNTHLIQLHLTKSMVNGDNLEKLDSHPSLQKVFAYETPLAKEIKVEKLKELSFKVELGNFELPSLPTDQVKY
ncbi:c-type cytochrome domain-containing protein [Cognataquiflexum aquatile]|uniref:c-type cytochrome domain-containing protein n=1 Tax=Cognataquiflexum aquatile TaxID=2249427 RepID=UPI000DEB8B84|nr:c-type cytochrome domain-containing protein [Cognataquiflexum aquatile]